MGSNGVDVRARRFDRHGVAQGAEFTVNTYTTARQGSPSVALGAGGSFMVAWHSQEASGRVAARRFDAAGNPLGPEFLVGPSTSHYYVPSVASDSAGNFAVAWFNSDGSGPGVWARRFGADGTARGAEFRVNSYTTGDQRGSFSNRTVAADGAGNFVIVWESDLQDGDRGGVFGQRYGGLVPAGLAVVDGSNGVIEVGETIGLFTSWRNVSGAAQTFQGRTSNVVVPAGLSLAFLSDADYGTVADGAVGACSASCIAGSLTGTRPTGHVDASVVETIVPDVQGQTKRWVLHVGESFSDVPRSSPFYGFVETLLHRGVTAGCTGTTYCPATSITREQMSAFVLVAKEGEGYAPPACTTPVFGDVPASSPFCRFIEELARRGVTGGCGGGNYCPTAAVSREQMAVFVLRTLDPNLNPPACAPPNLFNDVPETSAFCPWIEELARRGITGGCGGGNYCPTAEVTREQMAVFLTGTFGLTLYGV